ncbi:RNA 2'-phosphotransferase [Desulfonema magnum]|uniref:Phosphotransferase domain-containing protein n=1 Tax=Desulfonema magnum TaxID=45655 RepID=A0A975GJY3_9BACT|nr:RNA 2'-phosphotransferase [Desulfonema magnum]QTA84164.1 Phosphotransferase domain-containing protein [Desulfonema magnum]
MGQQRSPQRLSKFLSYILERRPDEFGLILDPDGYVKIKDLIKAVCEEDGLRYVRRAAIDEILVTLPNPPIEIKGNYIRAKNREGLPKETFAKNPPKLLYTCVRKKAHGFVLEKGIFPQAYPKVILSSDRDLAERMGKRSDQSPILLTIQVQKAMNERVVFYQAGESLYLADAIPAGCFTAPPLPKQKAEIKKQKVPEEPKTQKFPGSFFIDFTEESEHKKQVARKRKKKQVTKEKDKRRMRKQKQKMWDNS